MTPRTILYTGKGGVGKTSVAAASARALAARGLRTLVISTDPAHSLSDSLGVELGGEPSAIGPRLWGQQISAQAEMQTHWSAVRDWMGELLAERGVDRISAEELTVPPGMDELFSLLVLREHHASGAFDAVIVDCAPTGETLRLLSFPDVARWWIEKVFPFERQILAAARPLARTLLDIPLPDQAVFADVQRLSEKLIAMNTILRDREHCSIRLVMNPDRMVIGEAMRTFTYLGLYGYLCDAVIVNRLFGEGVGDYFAGWRQTQTEHMELVREAFEPVPVLTAPFFEQEVLGAEMLDRLAGSLFDGADPAAVLFSGMSQQLSVSADGETSLRLALPLADKGRISLKKIGSELVVAVDGQRRTISLPPSMAQMRAGAARFENGELQIVFDAEPRPHHEAEALRALEERIERATRAAERLLAETRETRGPRGEDPPGAVPPRGWQRREHEAAEGAPSWGGWIDPEDARLLLGVLSELRERVPPELERRVVAALRELLLAVRALIDWCVERAEHRAAPAAEVQDIPIL